ncbi:MAG: HAD family hydrolase [Acidobacteriota bacterium]|jgi:HAD superfamily hydrolase (TIGR01549 family)
MTERWGPAGPIRAVLFDLDGTLVDSREDILASYRHAFKKLRRPLPDRDRLLDTIGTRLEDCFVPFVGGDVSHAEKGAAYFREWYEGHHLDHTRPFRGVLETLAALKDRYALGVATMKKGFYARKVVEGTGLFPYFRCVVGAEEGFAPKPSPDMLFHLMSELKVKPSETVYVGDTGLDFETARAAGCRFWFAAYGYGTLNGLGRGVPAAGSPSELLSLVPGDD